MDTYHVPNAIMMKPPRLSLKKRTLPLTKAVYKQPNKAVAAACSIRRAPRPITPDLFIPILSTIEVSNISETDLAKDPSVESNQDASPPSLIPHNNECDRDSSSSSTNTTPNKKQRKILPTFSQPFLSFPKPKIKPKKYRISKSMVIIDGGIGLFDTTGYDAPPEGKKVFQTTDTVPAAITLTPMLSPPPMGTPPMGTPIDPVSVIRRRFSESFVIDDSLSNYDFGRRENKTTPARVSLSEPLIILSIDELLDDYSTPPHISESPLLPQFQMRRSIKRCLEF